MYRQTRKGFSLIEMVIVILILGIIAAIAAPRMFDTANDARENTTRQQLAVLRNAIEMYRADSGAYPADSYLPEAMAIMLSGPFPGPSVGINAGDFDVYYDSTTTDEPVITSPGTAAGWAYKPSNGSLKVNADAADGGGRYINW